MTRESVHRLLVIEDDPASAKLVVQTLRRLGSADLELVHSVCMADAERLLPGGGFDIVLLDPGLPDSVGIESVRRVRSAAPQVPVVVLTGADDESLALEALQAGAQDYLVKGQIDMRGLLRFLRYAVERHSLEEALFVSEARAQVTLESIADAVVRTDELGLVTFLNPIAQQLTGWTWAEAVGQPVADVLCVLDSATRTRLAGPLESPNEQIQGDRLDIDRVLLRRDGIELPIEESVARIRDRNQQVAGAVIVFRDVSVARAQVAELRSVGESLTRSNRDLLDFVSMASHDLQEPVRKIQAFGELLRDRANGSLDDEAADYLLRMTAAAARTQLLINDLLEYSEVATRPESVHSVDLGEVAASVLNDLADEVRACAGDVAVGLLPTILGSRTQLFTLLHNLIENALRFHADGVAPRIDIDAVARHDQRRRRGQHGHRVTWEIRIRDNGIGISPTNSREGLHPVRPAECPRLVRGLGHGAGDLSEDRRAPGGFAELDLGTGCRNDLPDQPAPAPAQRGTPSSPSHARSVGSVGVALVARSVRAARTGSPGQGRRR